MSLVKNHLLQVTLLAFGGTYLVSALTSIQFFFTASAVFLVFAVLQVIPLAGRSNKIVALILFTLGGFFLASSNVSLQQWISAIASNSGLVVLFLALPLFSFPLSYEDYQPVIKGFSERYVRNNYQFANISAIITYFFSCLLNLGAFSLSYNLFRDTKAFAEAEKTLMVSVMRANTAALFWSPNYIAAAVVLNSLELPWIRIVPYGILLSFIVMLMNWFTTLLNFKRKPQYFSLDTNQSKEALDKSKLFSLLGTFISLMLMVGLLNIFTQIKILVIIPIVALIHPILLGILKNKLPLYTQQLKGYYQFKLANLKNEIVIFAAVGFFGKSLEITGFGAFVPSLLQIDKIHNPTIAIMMLMSLMGVASAFGIHPAVTITAIAATIGHNDLGISLNSYAFVLLAGYGLSVSVSPFSAMSLVLSGIRKRSPWEGPRENFLFSITMAIIFAIILPFIP